MHHLSHDIRLDGYEIVRRSDLTAVETEFPQRQMLERALALKKLEPFAPSGFELTDVPGTLTNIQLHFPLVVIHRERVVPGECEIGTIKLAGHGTYALRWLSPNATWESDSRRFRFDDITRIGFGAEYETTLALVAGVTA